MAAPQQQVLEAIRRQCDSVEERFPDYRREALAMLADVIALERARPHDIVNQLEAKFEALGNLLLRRTAAEEAV
jgi:hypothetical protein